MKKIDKILDKILILASIITFVIVVGCGIVALSYQFNNIQKAKEIEKLQGELKEQMIEMDKAIIELREMKNQ